MTTVDHRLEGQPTVEAGLAAEEMKREAEQEVLQRPSLALT